jgi:quercetin dioxygenase-like cupin family protein
MINKGDTILNVRTGQTMIFLTTGHETQGQLLEIECYNPPSDIHEPRHVHPKQASSNEVLSGQLHFWIDGNSRVVKAGERIDIPAGVPHQFWNEGPGTAHHIGRFTPALTIADFFDTFFALARDGKLNKKGIPNFLQACVIALKHKDDIRILQPPWPIQLTAYTLLAPLGRLLGYQAKYSSNKP